MVHGLNSNDTVNTYMMTSDKECYVSMAEMLRPKKLAKKQHLSTCTLGYIHSRNKSLKLKYQKRVRILFDTG